jgi:hypothetical protein
MNLTELAQPKKKQAQRALREHFEINIDLNTMNAQKTRSMLTKVRGLLKESTRSVHGTNASPAHLKLVMMEQMLSQHYSDIRVQTRIVTENEEVEKSQVILAAQDLIDQLQKMVEQISKMNAEELPAVVSGISNEIGTSESEAYNQSVSEALTTLLAAVTTAKGSLTSSLGTITGEGGGDMMSGDEGFGGGAEEEDFSGEEPLPGGGEEDFSGEEESDALPELPEPDEELGSAGRELR